MGLGQRTEQPGPAQPGRADPHGRTGNIAAGFVLHGEAPVHQHGQEPVGGGRSHPQLLGGVLQPQRPAVALVVLVSGPSVSIVYLMLVLAGVGTHGTQCLIIAAVASHYPAHLRGTALGWALGTGRIGAVVAPQVGGLLLAAGLGVNSNFLAFAGAAGIAAVLLAAVGINLKSKLSTSPSIPTTGVSNV